MKKNIGVCLSLMLVWAFQINAQELALEKISKAPIIFEGKVISSNSFKDSVGNIWTSNKIFVTKVLKGEEQINSDTVELILRGGNNHDSGLLERPHHLDWFSGGAGVYLCNVSNVNRNFPALELATGKSSRFTYINDGKTRDNAFKPIIVYGPSSFYSIEEFYTFLKEQPNIRMNDTSIHPVIKEYFNAEKKK